MPKNRRSRIVRTAGWFAVLFVLLFAFRLLYGFFGAKNPDETYAIGYDYFGSLTNLRKNYATENQQKMASIQVEDPFSTQKYEKTATVSSGTAHFDDDDSLIRKLTNSFEGTIQYEKSLGKKGSRELHLSIGVKPDSFDSFYKAVQIIGQLRSTTITKMDKTNEYRQLNAKKASLEKNLASLSELKNKSGAINDYISLHDKIREVETQLQELGVDLGNFNTQNEFCTLRYSLFEGRARQAISSFQRVKIALEWTIKYYAISIFALAGVFGCSFLLLLVVDRLKALPAAFPQLRE
jgi:hypothetical protein